MGEKMVTTLEREVDKKCVLGPEFDDKSMSKENGVRRVQIATFIRATLRVFNEYNRCITHGTTEYYHDKLPHPDSY